MNVLISSRPTEGTKLTGDTIMIQETSAALEKLGVKVTISKKLLPDMNSFDVIHLFGTLVPYPTFLRLQRAKSLNKPVVVSTIFWDWDTNELRNEDILRMEKRGYFIYRIRKKIQLIIPAFPRAIIYKILDCETKLPFSYYLSKLHTEKEIGVNGIRKTIYENADVLLPNSYEEYHYLQRKCNISNDYIVVPNGVNSDFEDGDARSFEKLFGIRDFVLCVAAICSRKNQLRLIQAMQSITIPLVLVGAEEKKYGALCRKQASKNVYFLGQMDREDIKNAFAAARVHVLPSFYETPGIATLEAALAGCAIVSTDRGCTREYLGNDVFYCQPTSIDSIREAIIKALRVGPSSALKERIKKEYTWEVAAKKTIEAYQMALRKG